MGKMVDRMKKYVVTGGAGFIGSNFVDLLLTKESDIHVTVLDKLTYSGNMENIKRFEGRKDFDFVYGDICDEKIVNQVVKDANYVINFAAEVAVDRSIANQGSFLKTDIWGVYTLLEGIRKHSSSIETFIQISTDEVYGHILEGSFTECSELKPRNPYAASKLGGERLAYSYYETYDLPIIITRASNTYGPYAFPEKVIPLFVTNILEGKQVPLYGEGKQVRDWIYVEDHCEAIYNLLSLGKKGEVYNISANEECSNIEMTRMILDKLKVDESYIKYVADRPGHDFRYSLNTDKIRKIGWHPKYDLKKGLDKTIQWYIDHERYWKPLRERLGEKYINGFWGNRKDVL